MLQSVSCIIALKRKMVPELVNWIQLFHKRAGQNYRRLHWHK